MHQAYRHQGRRKVQKSVGGMGGPKNIEDLLKEKGVCFWDSQNMGGGMGPLAPLAPRYRRPWHMILEIFDKSSSGDTKFEFFKGYFAIWVIICSFDPLIHLILEINEYFF